MHIKAGKILAGLLSFQEFSRVGNLHITRTLFVTGAGLRTNKTFFSLDLKYYKTCSF